MRNIILRSRPTIGALRPQLRKLFTVLIPWEPIAVKRTEWHPRGADRGGPFHVLWRGAFDSEIKAHAWAKAHLDGARYYVRPVAALDADGNALRAFPRRSGRS